MLIVLFLVLSIFLLQQGHALAKTNSSCNTASCTLNKEFDGAYRYASGWGASAGIGDYQVNSVCISSSAWAMIDNQSNSNELAQTGYLKLASWSTTTTYYFYEEGVSGQLYDPGIISVDSKNRGSTDVFTTYLDTGNGYIHYQINNQTQVSTIPDWTPNDQQWFAETHSDADHVVGGYNHHSLFGSVGYLYSGRWHYVNASSSMYNTASYGDYSISGSSSFVVWDTRVS